MYSKVSLSDLSGMLRGSTANCDRVVIFTLSLPCRLKVTNLRVIFISFHYFKTILWLAENSSTTNRRRRNWHQSDVSLMSDWCKFWLVEFKNSSEWPYFVPDVCSGWPIFVPEVCSGWHFFVPEFCSGWPIFVPEVCSGWHFFVPQFNFNWVTTQSKILFQFGQCPI